jgi:hypothetical protein
VEAITVEHTGKRGAPRKIIDADFLRNMLAPRRKITQVQLAEALGVHRNTISAYRTLYGIPSQFSNLDDDELDTLIEKYRTMRPDAGMRYVMGFLRSKHLRLQRERVRSAVHRVDGVGVRLRRRTAICRRVYRVPRPMALWHGDGYHKLIRYGFVIHGFIDGFSRKVCRTYYPFALRLTVIYRSSASEPHALTHHALSVDSFKEQ